MKVFLSYASEDREVADQVHLALTGAGHEVFFDRESLPPAGDYHAQIRSAIQESDLFLFLITPHSVEPGGYPVTELKFARRKWPHPKSRVLSVRLGNTPWEMIPGYLRAVTVLEPEGNLAAEVVAAVDDLRPEISAAARPVHEPSHARDEGRPSIDRPWARKRGVQLLVGALLLVLVGVAIMRWGNRDPSVSQGSAAGDSTGSAPVPAPGLAREPAPPVSTAGKEVVKVPPGKRALAISMIHETHKPRNYAGVYAVDGDLGYGQGYASLRNGRLYALLRRYSEAPRARFAGQARAYLSQLAARDSSLAADDQFKNLLVRIAGEDSIMVRLQDESIEQGYFGPARIACGEIGIQTALGFALIADTFLQSGRAGYESIKLATIRSVDGTPATGIDEKRWLKAFAAERIARYANRPFAAPIRRRTETYIRLMEMENWNLAAPVPVRVFLLVDP